MESKLIAGDYVPDGAGGFVRLTGTEALLAQVLFRLNCRRDAFAPLENFGSQMYLLGREKPSSRNMAARQYAVEALSSLPVTVTDTVVTEDADGVLHVAVSLTADGDEILEVTV